MSENTDKEAFEMAVFENLGQAALLKLKLSPIDIFERGWNAGLAHKKNESVAEALEKAAQICTNWANDIQEGIVNDPAMLASEIRALIKE